MSRIQKKATLKQVNIIQQVADEATRRGIVNDKSKAAIEWYRNFINKNVYKVRVFEHLETKRLRAWPTIGKMYMYGYDAKHKATLPYWDAFPCTIFFAEDSTSVTGINLHYLPTPMRVILLAKLYEIMTDSILTEKSKMMKSYSYLKGISQFNMIAPCIKKYLKSNFRTKLIEVPATQWPIAVFLPTAQWQGAHINTVYADTRKKVRGI